MTEQSEILVVDDLPDNLRLLGEILEAEGYTVRVATDGQHALENIKASPPDLILLDAVMPIMDGYEVCRRLKADPDLRTIPVIFISALDMASQKVRAFREGAVDYVTKPFQADEVLARVRTHLQLSQVEALQREIAERKHAEVALRASEQLYRSLFENMLNGFAYCRMLYDGEKPTDFIYLAVNQAFERQTGLKNVVGKKISELVPGIQESDRNVFEIYSRVVNTGVSEKFEIYVEAMKMWFAVSVYSPAQDHFVALFDGITERKRAEEALQKSEEHLRLALDAANAGTWEWDLQTNTNIWSDELWRLYGINKNSCKPTYETWRQSVRFVDRPALDQALSDAVTNGTEINIEWRVNVENGPERWIMSRGRPLNDAAGKVTGYRGIALDITERKLAEVALRDNQAKLEAALASMMDAVFITDAAGHFVHFNDACATFHRYKNKAECAKDLSAFPDLFEVYLPNGDPAPLEMWAVSRALRGETVVNAEYTVRRKDTGETWIGNYCFSPIRDKDGEIVGSVTVGRDITELKHAEAEKERLEAQLRQSQKMDAVGQLAGGIAHDFNNLLSIIHGYTTSVQEHLAQNTEDHEDLDEVRKAAERASDLTRQLLTFSRRQIIQPVHLDLNDLIESALKMIRRLIGEHIDLQFLPGTHLGTIHADKGQIEQILVNLCVNARDAMPKGGTLTIETKSVILDSAYCCEHPDAVEGPAVKMTVADTGHGMDEATRAQVFEPFFTTKGVGHGTGLGLATVYGIVKQHHGTIQLNTEPGNGAAFEIYLPSDQHGAKAAEVHTEQRVSGGNEGILLAEDEEGVRNLLCRQLTAEGYSVFTANNGEDALRVFAEHAANIKLAILDVMMPKLGGREVMMRIQANYPQMRFLFCSGYSESALHTGFIINEGLNLISKPYRRADLLRTVRNILDAPSTE